MVLGFLFLLENKNISNLGSCTVMIRGKIGCLSHVLCFIHRERNNNTTNVWKTRENTEMQTKVNILVVRLNDNVHTSGVNKWRLREGSRSSDLGGMGEKTRLM